MKPKTI